MRVERRRGARGRRSASRCRRRGACPPARAGPSCRARFSSRTGSTSSPPSSSRTRPAMCGRSHGTPPNCSACVISCSATQRSSSSLSASRLTAAWARLGDDEQQPRGRLGLEDRELVLAEHALAEDPRHGADLDRQQRAARGPDRARERAHALAEAGRDRVEHRLQRGQVGLDPQRAVDRLGVRQLGGGQPGVGRDEPRGLLGRAGDVLEGRRLGRGLEPGDALGDGGGELPVDHATYRGRRTLNPDKGPSA